jgi:hypothetical protein
VPQISGHGIPCGYRVVGRSLLGGLHHEYLLERKTARKIGETSEREFFAEHNMPCRATNKSPWIA